MNGLFLVTTFTRAAGSLKIYLSPHLLFIYSCFTLPDESWKVQSKPDLSQQDPNYASDAELLTAAGIVVLC